MSLTDRILQAKDPLSLDDLVNMLRASDRGEVNPKLDLILQTFNLVARSDEILGAILVAADHLEKAE